MIIVYNDSVSFQRCGDYALELVYDNLDVLYEADLMDGIILKRDWDKIAIIYPNGYGSFDEYCYLKDIEYRGELDNTYSIDAKTITGKDIDDTKYDYVFDKDTIEDNEPTGIAIKVTNLNGNSETYFIYAFNFYNKTPSVLIKGDSILVATNWDVIKISLKTHEILKRYEADDYIFDLHHSPWGGYILRKELSIASLDDNLKEKWDTPLADITTPAKGPDPFRITGEYVEVVDFEGNFYKIDKDGKVVK